MKVQYCEAKRPIDFDVGGDIVAMVTRVFVEITEIDFCLVSAILAALLLGSSSNLA